MADQYGVVIAMAQVEDPDATRANLLKLAHEWAPANDLRWLGDVEIIRHADVSELDWQLMNMTSPWSPGVEVWGWKGRAEQRQ